MNKPQKDNYGWNPRRTSLSEDEWISIYAHSYEPFPYDEPEDAVDAQPFDAMEQS